MKIALDYDKTYNVDKPFWNAVAALAHRHGHEVRIVTARSPVHDKIDGRVNSLRVIYCDGVAKRFHCHWFADWNPDVWIDDRVEGILTNSSATKESLEQWRSSPEHAA